MMRCVSRGSLLRTNFIRGLSTTSLPKEEHTFESDWETALPYSKIPGPTTFQLVSRFLPGGKYHNLSLIDIHDKIRNEYGLICRLPGTFGRRDVIFSFDPQDFEKVYRTEGAWPERRGLDSFVHYRKNIRPDVFKNMGGLVSEQGKSWATLRTKVNPVMLQPKAVKSYIPQVDAVAAEFLQLAQATRDSNDELPASFGNDLNKWALESIGVIALDQRLGVLGENNPDAKLLITSIRDFLRLSYELDIMPSVWKYVETPKFKQLMHTFDNLTDLILKYIDCRVKELDARQSNQSSVHEASVLEKLLSIDRHAAVVMAMDMLFAGVDTTSTAVIGCLYHLAKNPEKQEKLRNEIRTILPTKNSQLSVDSLTNVPYMRACLKEAIRLSPIVVGGFRATGQDIVLQGYQVPKGTDVGLANAVLQRDEHHYPQNKQFIPERWLKADAAAAQCPSARSANPFIYLPFGFGARACIGKRFAEMEVEVILSRIIRNYNVEYNYPPIKYVTFLIQTPVSALKFKLSDIKE